jgi:hypothetical protein
MNKIEIAKRSGAKNPGSIRGGRTSDTRQTEKVVEPEFFDALACAWVAWKEDGARAGDIVDSLEDRKEVIAGVNVGRPVQSKQEKITSLELPRSHAG